MGTEKLPVNRRRFLAAAAALSAPLIIPRHVLGDEKTASANEKIVVGHIGIGKQMRGHVAAATRSPKVKVVAVCDVDKTRRLAGKKQVDDAYHNTDCAAYDDYREMLARRDIDAIVCATPDHWHAMVILDTCKAGKDLYCEKPLTNNLMEAKRVMDAVTRSKIVFQVGSQQCCCANSATPANWSATVIWARSNKCWWAWADRRNRATCPAKSWSRGWIGSVGRGPPRPARTVRSLARAASTIIFPRGGCSASMAAAA